MRATAITPTLKLATARLEFSSHRRFTQVLQFVAVAALVFLAVAIGRELMADNLAAAAALNPKPADWTSPAAQSESDGEIFWKISTGRGAMPPWKHLPETDRWAIVHYIRSLKAN